MAAGGKAENKNRSRRARAESQIPSWALPPLAVEHVRQEMLRRVTNRDWLLALRDATIVSLQFGLSCRNQEVYGLRWRCFDEPGRAVIEEVVSFGRLDEPKTENSTRKTNYPSLLAEDLEWWRSALTQRGVPTGPADFVIPGNLAGWGTLDANSGASHFSGNQARKWGPKYFRPAVEAVAKAEAAHADISGANPYALRRGGISLRLRAEPAADVAREVGSSLQMLNLHYRFAIESLRETGSRPVDDEWRAARAAVPDQNSVSALRRHLRAVA